MTHYVPVACAFHDRLEHLVMRRTPCRIRYQDGREERRIEGVIRDIITADGAEYLVMADDAMRVRLDSIREIETMQP